MDLLHGFEVLSTTEETLFNSQSFLPDTCQGKKCASDGAKWHPIKNGCASA